MIKGAYAPSKGILVAEGEDGLGPVPHERSRRFERHANQGLGPA